MRSIAVGLIIVAWMTRGFCSDRLEKGRNEIHFRDVADHSGVRIRHYSPLSSDRHLHLFMGSGVAWMDLDRDGSPDLYVCQGRAWPHSSEPDPQNTNRLWRNRGDGTFTDATSMSHATDLEYSMGTAVGDYDNDGFADLYISSFGPNRLFHNNGDGTFTEVAHGVGLDDPRYGAGCTWTDIDSDGSLDLFVCNYLKFDNENYPLCHDEGAGTTYPSGCHPRYLPSEYDIIYRSGGDGTFDDVSERAGLLDDPSRAGLGVVAADLDADGDVDIYVANDSLPNQLWVNDGKGRFVDQALVSGTAVNRFGKWEAGMGVAVGDVNGDAKFDLFITNFFHETNTLYRNEGSLFFLDATRELGLAAASHTRLAFGTSLFDVDNDGWQDLFIANGHIHTHLEELGRQEPYAQLPQLFRNQKGERFADVSLDSGPYFATPVVGRSSATADYDGDGKLDLAVLHLNGPLALLHNETPHAGQSLGLELIGTASCRDAIGAIVEVTTATRTHHHLRRGSTGYLSSDAGGVTIGMGQETTGRVVVRWPGGVAESFGELDAGSVHQLIEGMGTALP